MLLSRPAKSRFLRGGQGSCILKALLVTPFGKLVIKTLILIQELALDRTQLPPSQREKTNAASRGKWNRKVTLGRG